MWGVETQAVGGGVHTGSSSVGRACLEREGWPHLWMPHPGVSEPKQGEKELGGQGLVLGIGAKQGEEDSMQMGGQEWSLRRASAHRQPGVGCQSQSEVVRTPGGERPFVVNQSLYEGTKASTQWWWVGCRPAQSTKLGMEGQPGMGL